MYGLVGWLGGVCLGVLVGLMVCVLGELAGLMVGVYVS